MNLVVVEGLHLSYGERTLLNGVGFRVGMGERIGLVGSNGTGKSTLFRLIQGTVEPDRGTITRAKNLRIGHLPQDVVELAGSTPLDTVLSMVPGRNALLTEIADLEIELARAADPAEQMELSRGLAHLHTELDLFENTFSEHEAKRILMGLGFLETDLGRPLHEFSSGWVMRVALAAVLFQQPDLLLLDEPTNHLDVPSMAWLDEFLRGFQHALVLITHDREFLNRQIERIISLEPEGLRTHVGDWDSYKRSREKLELELEERARRQSEQIERAERFITRFRAKATKARAVQSKIKQLDKLERVQVLGHRKTVRFSFPEVARSGKDVLRLERVCKSFGELKLYDELDELVSRGERIAIVGRNGAGKTTLMRIMAGELEADSGEIHWGHNVTLAFYTQRHADALDTSKSVLESVWSLVPSMPQSEVRGVLGAFLFTGDDVQKQIGVLSGGERARVALARLLVKPANLMLMDEPTNHLDLESAEMLAEALQDYSGTLLFVSHNRSFVNRLATRVWEIDQGRLSSFPGNLNDYLYHRQRLDQYEAQAQQQAETKSEQGKEKSETAYERRKRIGVESKVYRDKLRPLMKKAEELEKRIAELELEQAELSQTLADPNTYKQDETKTRELVMRYDSNRVKIVELTGRWEYQVEQAQPIQDKLDELTREADGE